MSRRSSYTFPMALEEYRRKRNFQKSPEPEGKSLPGNKKSAKLFFCVQKHLASHLHYDVRLEWHGVLLSWAVPKGPSLNPADKRLAMHVEDHPIEYGSFEGVIPEGYGAGIVMLWDQGTWEPEVDDVDAALKKGDLKFTLDGYKLKGSWVLIRTRGYGGSSGSGASRSWLLIKHKDDWSGPIDITEFAPLSVKTPEADFADILAADNPEIWTSNRPAKGGDTGAMFGKIVQRALEIKDKNTNTNTKDTKITKAKTGKAKTEKAKTEKTKTGKAKAGKAKAK
jgi:bifunctional non-homologous end joining protein LigD